MPEQEPFDLTGAPRPWIGRYWWNRLSLWLHRRRHRTSRDDMLRMMTRRD